MPEPSAEIRSTSLWKLLTVATVVAAVLGGLLYQLVSYYVLFNAEKNLQNLLLSHRGIHQYIQRTMHPAFYEYRESGAIPEDFYAPEILSSSMIVTLQHKYYSEARREAGLPDVYYKMAAMNPRNPLNAADADEIRLIKLFNEKRDLKSYREIVELDGKKFLYYAVPFLANEVRCLACHGRREDATIGVQKRYPGNGGYNEEVGVIRAVESVRVPVEREYFSVHIIWISLFGGVVSILLLTYFNRNLRSTVLRRTQDLEKEVEERRRAEEKVRSLNVGLEKQVAERTRELEETNRALDAFAYSVSHDLRAPLRSIDGFSQLLQQDCGARLDDAAKGYLERVRAGCTRMGDLIHDLLQMSRSTQGELRRVQVDLSALAGEILEELRLQNPGRKVTVGVTPDLTAVADKALMHAVLENLLGNAWKFTGKTEHALIEFGTCMEGAQQVYFVRDNGVGFDMRYQGQVFKEFKRLHTSQEFEGTGIGLATVQRIIQRHGGRVWVEAAIGRGATFFFTVG